MDETNNSEWQTTLSFDRKQLRHPLFGACMQVVVGIRQKHSQQVLEQYAAHLEALAVEHIHQDRFN